MVLEARHIGEFDPDFAASAAEPVSQGDVIELVSPTSHEWEQHFGVVVTANCDLAWGKHLGALTYVPLLPISVYVPLIALPRQFDKRSRKLEQSLIRIFADVDRRPLYESIRSALDEGVTAKEVLSSIDEASLPNPTETRKVIARLGAYRGGITAIRALHQDADARVDPAKRGETAHRAMSLATEVFLAVDGIDGKAAGDSLKQAKAEMVRALTVETPGDVLVLNAIAPQLRSGYVAVLRLIREIDDRYISLQAVGGTSNEVRAKRISRLSVLYTHRLVQQMAQVFVDIGLPTSYEASRRDMSETEVGRLFADRLEVV